MTKNTDSTMPDWVLLEAAKRGKWPFRGPVLREDYQNSAVFRALCDLIYKHEQPPVDRKLLVAREAAAQVLQETGFPTAAKNIRAGEDDGHWSVRTALRFHELWESGHGK